jgi:hypothetical protein
MVLSMAPCTTPGATTTGVAVVLVEAVGPGEVELRISSTAGLSVGDAITINGHYALINAIAGDWITLSVGLLLGADAGARMVVLAEPDIDKQFRATIISTVGVGAPTQAPVTTLGVADRVGADTDDADQSVAAPTTRGSQSESENNREQGKGKVLSSSKTKAKGKGKKTDSTSKRKGKGKWKGKGKGKGKGTKHAGGDAIAKGASIQAKAAGWAGASAGSGSDGGPLIVFGLVFAATLIGLGMLVNTHFHKRHTSGHGNDALRRTLVANGNGANDVKYAVVAMLDHQLASSDAADGGDSDKDACLLSGCDRSYGTQIV